MAFSNKLLDDSILNLKRFKNIYKLLPEYLRNHTASPKDRDNQTLIECARTNNSIQVLSAPTTKAHADQLGRGMTSPSMWWDEFAFLKYNGIVFAAAAPALSKATEAAKRNKTPYGKVISTTPNDRDSFEGSYAYSILDNAVRFDNKWYDKSVPEIKRIIENSSNNNFVYIKFSYRELGKTERWFREQCRELNNDLAKIKRELLLEWTLANDRSPFSEEQLDAVSRFIIDKPIDCLYLKGCYKFDVYEKLDNIVNTNWIVGIDIGGGLMQDYTVISIICPRTKKLKALFRSNSIVSDELIGLVEFMLQTFFPKAVIVPERNSLGMTIIDAMVKNPIIRPRLYYEVKDRIAERKVNRMNVSEMTKIKTKVEVFGQTTDKSSRDVMFRNILPYMINEEPENIICKELFDEIKTLERGNTGKIAARSGAHDDIVMSYLIGLYALLYGSNINKFVKLTPEVFNPENGEVYNDEADKKYRRFMSDILSNNKMPPELLKLYNEGKQARLNEIKNDDTIDDDNKKIIRNISWLLSKPNNNKRR